MSGIMVWPQPPCSPAHLSLSPWVVHGTVGSLTIVEAFYRRSPEFCWGLLWRGPVHFGRDGVGRGGVSVISLCAGFLSIVS